MDSVYMMIQHILHAENLNIRKVLFRQPVPSTHLSLFSTTLPLSREMKSEHPSAAPAAHFFPPSSLPPKIPWGRLLCHYTQGTLVSSSFISELYWCPSLGWSLVGSLLLSPGSWCTRFCLCLQKSVSPVLCKFWQLSGGVNGDLLQEGLGNTQVCWTQSPAPAAGHCWPTCTSTGDTQTLRHSGLAQCLWRLLVCTRFCWVLRVSLAGTGFDSKCSFAPSTIFLLFPLSQSLPSENFHKPLILIHQRADRLKSTTTENQMKKGASPLPLDMGYLFLVGSNILLLMVVQQRVVILEFSQEKVTTCPPTPPSWIPSKFILPINSHIKTFTAASIAEDQKQSKRLQ